MDNVCPIEGMQYSKNCVFNHSCLCAHAWAGALSHNVHGVTQACVDCQTWHATSPLLLTLLKALQDRLVMLPLKHQMQRLV